MGTPASVGWPLACPDWATRIREGRSLIPDLPHLNHEEAQKAVEMFDLLRLPDVGDGRPSKGPAASWFREIVRALHGSYDPETNVRHIRETFILAPKKSSKTTYCAALMLTSLLINRRPRAELILIAPTQEVTEVAFNQAVGMIEADPVLSQRLHIRDHVKTIVDRTTNARLKIKSFDPKVVSGVKPVGVLIDELHTVPQNDADRVLGQLRGGLILAERGLPRPDHDAERASAGRRLPRGIDEGPRDPGRPDNRRDAPGPL